jgi:hypothetical protein
MFKKFIHSISIVILILILSIIGLFSACKDSPVAQQEIIKDTANVTYTNSISEILSANCLRCHNTGNTSGYVNLDSYENAKPFGINGNLYGCVQRLDGNVGMPIGAPKLDSLNLLLIKRWTILHCPL